MMKLKPTIEIAKVDDLEQIVNIWKKGLNKNQREDILEQETIDKFIENFENKEFPYEFWVVRNNNKILSFCSILPMFQNALKYNKFGELSIYSLLNRESMNHSRGLIDYVIKQLKKSTIETVIAMISKDNIESIRTAEKLNWQTCGCISGKLIFSKEI